MKNKKGKAKKKNNSSKNKVCLNDEKLIKIYEEACYRALKRIENEKEKQNDEEIRLFISMCGIENWLKAA